MFVMMNADPESPALGHLQQQQQQQQQQQPQQQKRQRQRHHQAQPPPALESVTKTLTRLVSIPSNRSCADCKSPLVDALQVYASYSSPENHEINSNHNFRQSSSLRPTTFHQNHYQLAPPGAAANWKTRNIPVVYDPPVDPAVTVSEWCGHGVFVCALCGAAHKLLRNVTTVAAVHDPQHWTLERVQILAHAGGNARATAVLEAYYTPQAQYMVPRPSNTHPTNATLADRLTFCRAKYEALAFCLPPALGPCARDAWHSLVQRHAEWKTLWNHPSNAVEGDGTDWTRLPSLSGLELKSREQQQQHLSYYWNSPSAQRIVQEQQLQPSRTAELPDRLVDYFCVVTASDYLHPSCSSKDLTNAESPQDVWLAPRVADCFPDPNNDSSFDDNNNNNPMDDASSLDSVANDHQCPAFPEHVSTFVFPDGCCASTTALPPSFYTLVLTNASGERLYGGVLRLYDDGVDTVETLQRIMDHSEYPDHLRPPWLRRKRYAPHTTQQQQQQPKHQPPPSSNNSYSNPFDTPPTNRLPPRSMSSSSIRTTDSYHSQTSAGNNNGSDVMFLPKCLVILSHYPFFDLWRNFLLQIYRIALTEAPLPMERFVANFVREVPLPPPGKVQVKFGFTVKDIWTIERPPENQLPMANFSFRPLFASLSVSNVIVVVGCLLQETRVALVSKHFALLGPVAEALLSFLFPLHWQGLYLTLVPRHMLDILDAPVPYLVGLHARYLRETPAEDRPHGVVFVDLDRDEVHLGFADDAARTKRCIPSLPERDAGKLKDMLVKHAACAYVMPNTQTVGSITTGKGEQIPNSERECYAQISALEKPSPELFVRRRDVFPNMDKAFRDNELLNPISGFLSEHGQLYQRDTSQQELAIKAKKPMLKLPPALRRHGSRGTNHPHHHLPSHGDLDSTIVENLLDLNEPTGFSSLEIRQAFLRFFVSLFRDYKKFLDAESFRNEEFLDGLGLSAGSTAFVKCLLRTQMFQVFTDERRENPSDPEVLFFDDSITAKLNRSKKTTLTRGGKKETKFLNDTGSMVTETFTPPPPSNWGLESGRTYQYGTFPTLDPALFGQIRPPMKFENRQRSSIRLSRRMSAVVQANERVVVEKATRSVLTKVTKLGVRNLETALKALSTPFVPPRRTAASTPSRKMMKESPANSVVSDVTNPSTFELNDDVVSSAELMIWNARRKQAILIGIIVKLQRLCRQYLERKRESVPLHQVSMIVNDFERARRFSLLMQQTAAATRIQRLFRVWRIRRAAVRIQAWRRGNTVYWAFRMLVSAVSRIQAVYRGVAVRQACRKLLADRLDVYRTRIFRLWQQADTPLSYRSKFWPLLYQIGFVRLAIAENELKRLWKELGVQASLTLDQVGSTEIESLQLGDRLGIRSDVFNKCIRIADIRPSGLPMTRSMRASKSNGSKLRGSAAERVLAERLQVYERLSFPASADRTNEIFSNFSIPVNDKRRKATLADIVWCHLDEADRSSELFLQLFPELRDSTNIFFMVPSKKALRRFPSSSGVTPSVLDESMWAHRLLDDRVRRHTAEIADISLHYVPERMKRLDGSRCFRKSSAQSEMVKSIMSSRDIKCESMARRITMREKLFERRGAAERSAAAGSRTKGMTKSNGVDKVSSYRPLATFSWEQDGRGTANSLSSPDRNGGSMPIERSREERPPGDRFLVRQ